MTAADPTLPSPGPLTQPAADIDIVAVTSPA